MSLLENIKEALERKQDELQECRDELDCVIEFIWDLTHRLNEIEKQLLAPSTDSVQRNRNFAEKKTIECDLNENTEHRYELESRIYILESKIELLKGRFHDPSNALDYPIRFCLKWWDPRTGRREGLYLEMGIPHPL